MKKGLFSILAGALLVVGCQNYDDQFSNIESQITALASQVAGLSQVQSDLSTLAGTVNSLASTVNGLGDAIDTAVSDGLTDIQADITDIETAVANVASEEAVSLLSQAVSNTQGDLTELLANSSLFQGNVSITNEATLQAFKTIGSGINIVNGDVTISVTSAMTHADVQIVVDNILSITGDLNYTVTGSGASTIAETTFNKLAGVQSMTLKQGGGYQAKTLTSASNIILDDAYKSTVTIVDLRALNNLTSIGDTNGNGSLKFNKATEMHLTSIALYNGNLDLQVKVGGVIDLSALDDLTAAGTAAGSTFAISIDGPASQTFTTISDGTITAKNTASLTVSGFTGKTVVLAGVETLSLTDAVQVDLALAADLVTATIDGAKDTDTVRVAALTATALAAQTGPAISFVSQDLTTATISGDVASVSAVSQANLETLTVSADLAKGKLTVTGNGDLTSLVVTGAKIGDVDVSTNLDLESLTMDHTTVVSTAAKGATVKIDGNTNMTSLTFSADKVKSLTVNGNSQLATVNFTGLATMGTATSAVALVKGNALVATSAKDAYNAAVSATVADAGAFVSTSGMKTLVTYLTAVMKSTLSDVDVYFDTVELVQTQSGSTAAAYVDASHTDSQTGSTYNAYAYQTPAIPDTTPNVREIASFVADLGVNALFATSPLASGEGITITWGGVAKVFKQGTSPSITTVTEFIAAINADSTWGSGITVTAAQDSYMKSYQTISLVNAAGAGANTGGDTMATVVWVFGTSTGSVAIGSNSTTTQLATAVAAGISGTVEGGYRWNAAGSAASVVFIAEVTGTGTNQDRGTGITFPALSFDLDNITSTTVDFSVSATTTNSTGVNSDFFLSVGNTITKGLRIQVKNNSTTVALTGLTVTDTASTENSLTILGAGFTALVSGTNMAGNNAVDATFAEVTVTGAGVAVVTTNRLGW